MSDMETKPQDWESETFDIIGLGQVTATGTRSNGLLRSALADTQVRGRPVELAAYWTVDAADTLVLGVLAAGGGRGIPRPGDRELAELRGLVEPALEEWWATPEAKQMIERNDLRARFSPEAMAQLAHLRVQREALRQALATPTSVAGMERTIRDLRDIERALAELVDLPPDRSHP